MGVESKQIAGVFGGSGGGETSLVLVWTIILVCLAIFGYAFTQVYGEQIHDITAGESTDETDLATNIGQIIFTPKVMGLAFLMVVAGFSIRFISAGSS